MNKKQKIFFAFISIFLLALVIFYAFKEKKLSKREMNSILVERVARVYEKWEEGEQSWICEKYFDKSIKYHQVYLECNPNLLRCFVDNQEDFKIKEILHPPKWNKFGIVISAKYKDYERDFIFYDTCKEILLPERIYALGEYKKYNDFKWDNFKRKIYFDRTLVTRSEVMEWINQVKPKRSNVLRELNSNKEYFHLPARGLLKDEMESFCQFKGKKVLEAHVWDAASFIPKELNQPRDQNVYRSEFSWTKNYKDSFLTHTQELTELDCKHAFISGCEKIMNYSDQVIGMPSWTGMFQILGGVMEYLENPFRPKRNLKVSNYELPRSSKWHVLGRRGYWDGEGLEINNISTHRYDLSVEIQTPLYISFRCMRYD